MRLALKQVLFQDLYSHVDAALRDLLRDRMATLFKTPVKNEILNASKHKNLKKKPKGLYGGDDGIRSSIKSAVKQDTYIAKAVTKPSYPKSKSGYSVGSSSRRRSRSRSRDRGGNRNDERKSKGFSHSNKSSKRKSFSKGGSSKDSSRGGVSKKPRYDKDKKGTMPTCFNSVWSSFISPMAVLMVTTLGLTVDNIPALESEPIGGRIRKCLDNWKIVCSNNWVIKVIEDGYKIPLKSQPHQRSVPQNPQVSASAFDVLVQEAESLKAKCAVIPVHSCEGQYISTYFAVPKPRRIDAWRPILNLKYFNRHVSKYKFQMETLSKVRDWIQPGAYCVGLDIRDAFLHIPMSKDSKKYLRFQWLGEILEWQVLVFGLTCSPRVITKVIKPVIAFLRNTWNILISIYIDDILIQNVSAKECSFHTQLVTLIFMCLGWSFKWEKCSPNLKPRQKFTHLGFDFDTRSMLISVPADKVLKAQTLCSSISNFGKASVHTLEKLIGTLESLKPATPLATLHFRSLQSQLLEAKSAIRNPEKIVFLSQDSMVELKWWISPEGFAANSSASIREREPTIQIWSDANLSGGGSHSSRGDYTQRKWTPEELLSSHHINFLEIRAAKESLSLAEPGDRVRLFIDSRTAAAYIRRQGGTRSAELSAEACALWRLAMSRHITILSPVWLSTKENIMADFLSRYSMRQWECQISRSTFLTILARFQVSPTLDCFASKETKMLPRYMTWYPDPEAVARDAMLNPWDNVCYLFPPVPLILKVLQKVKMEKVQAVLIVPMWPSALWWSVLQELLMEPPITLPNFKTVLTMVNKNYDLPYLHPLIAAHIQG